MAKIPQRKIVIDTSRGTQAELADRLHSVIADHAQGQPKSECSLHIILEGNRPIVTQGIPMYAGLRISGPGTFMAGEIAFLKQAPGSTQPLFITPEEWIGTPGGSGNVWFNHGFMLENMRLEGDAQNQLQPIDLMVNQTGGFGMSLSNVFFRNASGVGFRQLKTIYNVYGERLDFARCQKGAMYFDCWGYSNGGGSFSKGQIDNCGRDPVTVIHGKSNTPWHSAAQYTFSDFKFEAQSKFGDLDPMRCFFRVENTSPHNRPLINIERITYSTDIAPRDEVVAETVILDTTAPEFERPRVKAGSITGRGVQFKGIYSAENSTEFYKTDVGTPQRSLECIDDIVFGNNRRHWLASIRRYIR